jgi:hypothetical protein
MPLVREHGFSAAAIARMLSGQDTGEIVYAITDGTAVKIGKCVGQHPRERLAELQTGNPRQLLLVAYTHGKESVWHRVLARDRVRGEWFRSTERVQEALLGWDWIDSAVLRSLRGTTTYQDAVVRYQRSNTSNPQE